MAEDTVRAKTTSTKTVEARPSASPASTTPSLDSSSAYKIAAPANVEAGATPRVERGGGREGARERVGGDNLAVLNKLTPAVQKMR